MPRSPIWLLSKYCRHTAAWSLLWLSIAGFVVSCTPNQAQAPVTAATGSDRLPKTQTLKIAVTPALSATEQNEQLQALTDYLQTTLKQPVAFQVAKSYDESVELIVQEKVEVAYLGPLSYVKAKQRNPNLEPILASIEKSTGRPWYTSVIVVDASRGIKALSDLKGKRMAFVSRSSTSGYLLPATHLQNIGFDLQRDFASVRYSGSHDQAEADLEAGLVDAIADSKASYLKRQKSGKLNPDQYPVLWESEPIPTSPIVITQQMPPQLIAELKKALINAPEGLADITGAESAGYTLVQDADYEPIRQLQSRLQAESSQKP